MEITRIFGNKAKHEVISCITNDLKKKQRKNKGRMNRCNEKKMEESKYEKMKNR